MIIDLIATDDLSSFAFVTSINILTQFNYCLILLRIFDLQQVIVEILLEFLNLAIKAADSPFFLIIKVRFYTFSH